LAEFAVQLQIVGGFARALHVLRTLDAGQAVINAGGAVVGGVRGRCGKRGEGGDDQKAGQGPAGRCCHA
jgi:hypothetical protein